MDCMTKARGSIKMLTFIWLGYSTFTAFGKVQLDPMLPCLVPRFEDISLSSDDIAMNVDRRRSDLRTALHNNRPVIGLADDDGDDCISVQIWAAFRMPFVCSVGDR